MHDIRAIRENPAAFDAALSRRGVAPVSSQILAIDEARRGAIHAAETAQADQNAASKLVGAAKAKGDEAEFERLRALVAAKKAEVAEMQARAKDLDAQLAGLLMGIANLPLLTEHEYAEALRARLPQIEARIAAVNEAERSRAPLPLAAREVFSYSLSLLEAERSWLASRVQVSND